jgi:heme exporter protein CcmD
MDWSSEHAGFVIAAYAIVAVVLIGLVMQGLSRARTLKKTLADMKLSDPGQTDDSP